MNTSIASEPPVGPGVHKTPPHHESKSSEPTLARIAQEDPNGPPLFELRAEYAIDPGDAPCILSGTFARLIARAADLMLSAIYFIGLGAMAPLVRSRDPLNLAGRGSMRWLAPSATTMRARIGSNR